MRKIIVSMHVSLDGFVAGTKGEMDWISFDDSLFDFVGQFTDQADAALYGRVTYQMMDAYWPTAADQPNATKHDVEHSRWYKQVNKIVLSRTMQGKTAIKTTFIGENVSAEIQKLKQQPGKDILIFGSPSVVHTLMEHNLIDDYWQFVNPAILGQGIALFGKVKERTKLKLETTKEFACGVIALHHSVVR
jgi:dihydrofolate reductase